MVSLSRIAEDSLLFINKQVGDDYNKYEIESHLRWGSERDWDENRMPEIVKNWGIDEQKIILISCRHHDLETVAFEFESIDDLESHIKSEKSFLNPFITYVIPVIFGEISSFSIINADNQKIVKEDFNWAKSENFKNLTIVWD